MFAATVSWVSRIVIQVAKKFLYGGDGVLGEWYPGRSVRQRSSMYQEALGGRLKQELDEIWPLATIG